MDCNINYFYRLTPILNNVLINTMTIEVCIYIINQTDGIVSKILTSDIYIYIYIST